MSSIRRAACIGAGVIGAGWAARLLWHGIDVAIYDPHPAAERRLNEVVANADRALNRLMLVPPPVKGRLRMASSVAAAVEDADLVQESAPEEEALKRRMLAEIDRHAPAATLVCSSTSGLLPSRLQSDMARPERFMVAHPFNPVYLLPLVELCGGAKTAPAAIARAAEFFRAIGMRPLTIRKEIDGFVADRLLEALWREALWLVHDDVATVEDVDDAVRFGAGLRWAMMGTFLVYRIAGGEDGMRHFMTQFGPALKWPWTKLMDVPDLTEAFIDKIAAQSDVQAKGLSLRELERKRDDGLVAILQALKTQDFASGQVVAEHESRLIDRAHRASPRAAPEYSQPLRLYDTVVRPDQVDYNNHLSESSYLRLFGEATDAFLALIGVDKDYRAAGGSFFTAETHLAHLSQVAGLEPVSIATQVLGVDAKRLHLFHRMLHGKTGAALATAEQMMIHVDTKTGRAAPAAPAILSKAQAIFTQQESLSRPAEAGRAIGQPRAARAG